MCRSSVATGARERDRIGVETATKGQNMIANVKARYSEGVLKPMEPLDLEEGEEVLVSIEGARSVDSKAATLLGMLDEIHRLVPQEEWNDGPTDGARNFKHYLYGWPKDDAP